MIIPNFDGSQIVDKDGYATPMFANLLQNLFKGMTQSIGNEGYLIPSVSASDVTVLESKFQTDDSAINDNAVGITSGTQVGTLIFRPEIVNGGSVPVPNGQLYILLGDGTFHPVTNT